MTEQPTCPKCGQYDFECKCGDELRRAARLLKETTPTRMLLDTMQNKIDQLTKENERLKYICHNADIETSVFHENRKLKSELQKEMAVVDIYSEIFKGTEGCTNFDDGEYARTRIKERIKIDGE